MMEVIMGSKETFSSVKYSWLKNLKINLTHLRTRTWKRWEEIAGCLSGSLPSPPWFKPFPPVFHPETSGDPGPFSWWHFPSPGMYSAQTLSSVENPPQHRGYAHSLLLSHPAPPNGSHSLASPWPLTVLIQGGCPRPHVETRNHEQTPGAGDTWQQRPELQSHRYSVFGGMYIFWKKSQQISKLTNGTTNWSCDLDHIAFSPQKSSWI